MKPEYSNVDKFIEDALSSEPMLSEPSGMHAQLERRLQISALILKEKRGFRTRLVLASCLFSLLIAGGVSFVIYGGVSGLFQAAAPGAMGYFDYLCTSQANATLPSDILLSGLFIVTLLGCMTIAGVRFVLKRSLAK